MVGRDVNGNPVSSTRAVAYSDFAVSSQTCTISFHTKITANDRVVRDAEDHVPLTRLTMFDLTDSQLLDDQIPALKNIREVPRQLLLRVLSDSGGFSFYFRDVHSAARIWAEFATVFQLCSPAPYDPVAGVPLRQGPHDVGESAPAATAVFAKAAYVGMELAMRHAYKTGKSTESAWKCVAAQDPGNTFGTIYRSGLNRVFTPKELADVESFFRSPLGQKYAQYAILQVYRTVGEPPPGPVPKLSEAELRRLNSFSETSAGEKLLKHPFADEPKVKTELRTKMLDVVSACKSQAIEERARH